MKTISNFIKHGWFDKKFFKVREMVVQLVLTYLKGSDPR